MLINLLLILLYTGLFAIIIHRNTKGKNSFPGAALYTIAFVTKIVFGCMYGWFFLHFYGGDDTWYFHTESLKEWQLLKQDPWNFFRKDVFQSGYKENPLLTVFNSNDSFFKDLQQNLLIKMLAIFNLLSGGRYYVNVVFYNALVFWGSYCLYKTVKKYYPAKTNLWFWLIFFFPPLLFWTSGIRKDGLCFVCLSFCFYQTSLWISNPGKRKYLAGIIGAWLALFLLRNFLALSIVPMLMAWIYSSRYQRQSLSVYIAVLCMAMLLFFITAYLPASFNLPQKIADRQNAFNRLEGGSALTTYELEPGIRSYLGIIPTAADHVFLRPYPAQAFSGPLYILAFAENLLLLCLLLYVFLRPSQDWKEQIRQPFTLALLATALVNYIAIGCMVPFIGAIIRYKVIFEALLIIVLVQLSRLQLPFYSRHMVAQRPGNVANTPVP